jgi:hypothetical protein
MTNTRKISLMVLALLLTAPALMPTGSRASARHTATAADLARAAVSDLGGGKFRDLKSIRLAGVASAVSPLNPNVQPAEFQLLSTDTGIRIDLTLSFGLIQMINDGQRFYNLVNGNATNFGIAPPGKFGLRVLAKYDQPGYKITPLPEPNTEPGFRITDPEGNATDFYVHKETGRVTRFLYKFGDFNQTWELDNFKAVEGVMVAHQINIRLATRQGDFQMLLRAADAKINQPVGDNAFAPKGR